MIAMMMMMLNAHDNGTGENNISPMDPLGAENGQAWREDHQEDHHDAEEVEGAGQNGERVQITLGERPRHGGQFQISISH